MAGFSLQHFEQGLAERFVAASSNRESLALRGGGTKDFYGNAPRGAVVDLPVLASASEADLLAAVDHEPSELVVTAPAVLPLAALELLLAQRGQMLPFEPPHFAAGGTVGGCVAAGLAGPRRRSAGPTHGALRDFVLGARMVDGRGRALGFGGRVMKNVAGYDVSRLLAGSLGVLGALTEVSLKVLPKPLLELTLQQECEEAEGLARVNSWAGKPLPVSATAWEAGRLRVRLAGAPAAVEAAAARLGGEVMPTAEAEAFWAAVRDHRLPFFEGTAPCWRFSLPPNAEPVGLGPCLIEWSGAQRWYVSLLSAAELRARAAALGGHATAFRAAATRAEAFAPLSAPVLAIHRRMKAEFDPAGILNPGRLHPEW